MSHLLSEFSIGTMLAIASPVVGREWPGLPNEGQRVVRIIEELQDLPPDRTTSHAVASYVRAVLGLRALRREIAQKLLEVERCKKAIGGRLPAEALLAEAQGLLDDFDSKQVY
jgi:hypothetical protein